MITLTLTYVTKIIILSDRQNILVGARPLRKRTIAGRVIITRGCVIITGGSVIIKANIIASIIITSNGIQTDITRLLGITRKTTAYVITN